MDENDYNMDLIIPRLKSLLQNIGWSKEDVKKLFEALLKRFQLQKQQTVHFDTWMAKILYTIEIHKIDAKLTFSRDSSGIQLVSDSTKQEDSNSSNVIGLMSDSTIDDPTLLEVLGKAKEKDVKEIIEDIKQQDGVDGNLMDKVRNIVSNVSHAISNNDKQLLGDEMEKSQQQLGDEMEKILFKLCKAVQAHTKWKPRFTQMVSWCILALSQHSYLLQVGTGEGKSCIVAMFAAYRALKGQKVDIISSSPVLAERDANDWKAFYEELGLSVDCNTNKSSEEDLKKCYKHKVVYGTTESFAGDWLRHHFHRKDIRADRKFECVIVDEVDSLMLDKGLEVVYLSSKMPAMQYLNTILSRIWCVVSQHKKMGWGETAGPMQSFVQILQENTEANVQHILKLAEDRGIFPNGFAKDMAELSSQNRIQKLECISQSQIVDFFQLAEEKLPDYYFSLFHEEADGQQKVNIAGNGDVGDRHKISLLFLKGGLCRRLFSDKETCVKWVEQKIRSDLSFVSPEVTPEDSHIPGFQHFIQAKLGVWVQSAFQAQEMDLGHEYIIQGESVIPVDYPCTGVVQNNMRWSNGLQQFLEMKHQTKLSNMTAITNFMSNVRLFKMYEGQVYGISGTLGNKEEIEMLQELYKNMQTCVIPSFKRRKLFEEMGKTVKDEEDWLKAICSAVQEKVSPTSYRGERAVLVICETINRAEIIQKAIKNSLSNLSINLKCYTNSNLDPSEITGRQVQARDVIIATNLAGRGTDLKVSKEVNMAGGLFVVQTFLPLNTRVENQAFGRTARQGNPGSAQLIMCFSHFSISTIIEMAVNTSHLHMLAELMRDLYISILDLGAVKRWLSEALKEFNKEENNQQPCKEMTAALGVILSSLENPQKTVVTGAKEARDSIVKERLSSYLREDIPQMIKKEDLFSDYLKLLDELHEKHKDHKKVNVIVESMHECWALWLLMRFNENETKDTLKERFDEAMRNAKECLERGISPSSAVSFYIKYGNELRLQGRFRESIEMYTRAVEENDKDFIALYNRALSVMHLRGRDYISIALRDLEKAAESVVHSMNLIQEEFLNVVILQANPFTGDITGFIKQLQRQNRCFTCLKANIDEAVKKLKEAHTNGKRVKITEYGIFVLLDIRHLFQQSLQNEIEEMEKFRSLGLTHIFCPETQFSFSEFFSRLF